MGNVNDFKLALKSDSLNGVEYLELLLESRDTRFSLTMVGALATEFKIKSYGGGILWKKLWNWMKLWKKLS